MERALDPVRERLRLGARHLDQCAIEVEDKRRSLALHYGQLAAPAVALATAHSWLAEELHRVRITDGHHVVNVTPLDAPDKGDAMRTLLDEWRLSCALVVGDDSNDEAAFRGPHRVR